MFIDEASLRERLNSSNRNLDQVKFRRDKSVENPIVHDESIQIDSTPVVPSDLPGDAETLPVTSLTVQELPKRGRPEGYKNKTEAEKAIIGLEARILGQTASAKANGVSQAFAGLCEKGKESTDASSPINEVRKGKVDSEIEKLRSSALEALQSSVNVFSERITDAVKTSDAIGIASTLVKIVNISTPDEKRDQASRLIIMAPPQRDEKHYEVIDLN